MTNINNDLVDRINNQLSQYGNIRKSKCPPQLYEDIFNNTQFLPNTAKIKERVYCIQHNITSVVLCNYCNLYPVKFIGPLTGYRTYCSCVCSSNSINKQNKISQTNLIKYGTKAPAQNELVKQKTSVTIQERYGDNITCTQQLSKIKEKTKHTNQEKYGSNFYTNSIIGMKTITQAHLDHFNSIRFSQTDEFKEKIRQSSKILYNRNHPSQKHLSLDTIQKINDKDWLIDQHEHNSQAQIAKMLGVSPSLIQTKFAEFDIPTKSFSSSVGEQEIFSFIQANYNGKIVCRDRSIIYPLELDIYIPDLNIGIEYNGIYWHSENNGKDRKYHLNKFNQCRDKGVRLIQIYDIEWSNKTDIVKSRLLHSLNQSNRIFARKCNIVEVSQKQKRQFLNENHIQGDCSSNINIGLEYNNTLYSIMTFSSHRFGNSIQFELIRFASILNHSVIGGANKLFKHFVKTYHPTSIISYCDLRWGLGNVYNQLGMIQQQNTPPNYFYFKPNDTQLRSRQQFQKHKLINKLPHFDPTLSEWENMKFNGYYRIWNCGNAKFVFYPK